EQAKAIVEHRIPYRVAATVVREMTPEVLRALVECMSPQETINNLAALQRRGALEHPDIKAAVDAKLALAQADGRVSAYKAGVTAGGGTSCGVAIEQMRQKLQRVEQFVLVTDEDENTAPFFKDAYAAYSKELHVRPGVVIVKLGQVKDTLERASKELGVAPH